MSGNLTERTRAIPPDMLLDLAVGVEEPIDVAFRYGFSASEFKKLEQSQQFLQEIAQQRAENERNGVNAQVKAGMMYDAVAERYFMRVMGPDVALGALAQAVETFATLGNRKPKPKDIQQGAGQGFQVIINLPGKAAAESKEVATKTAFSFPTFDKPVTDVEVIDEPSTVHATAESGAISDIGQVCEPSSRSSGEHKDDSRDSQDSLRSPADSSLP